MNPDYFFLRMMRIVLPASFFISVIFVNKIGRGWKVLSAIVSVFLLALLYKQVRSYYKNRPEQFKALGFLVIRNGGHVILATNDIFSGLIFPVHFFPSDPSEAELYSKFAHLGLDTTKADIRRFQWWAVECLVAEIHVSESELVRLSQVLNGAIYDASLVFRGKLENLAPISMDVIIAP